jgi:eukaryotic-like serine/threonine-protein kinase
LAFIGGDAPESQLTWFDRSGTRLGTFGPAGVYGDVALSPDGRSVAFNRGSPADLWLLDSVRLASTRITAERADDRQPVWSPTGQTIAFTSNRAGGDAVYERISGVGGNERLLFQSAVPVMLSDWSRDGKYLTYASRGDVWALPLADARKPLQVTTSTNFQEQRAVFSPDGRWIAYHSDASTGITRSGEGDVFIQPFPQGGAVLQVSTGGGFAPQWSVDGREIFYVASDGVLMGVPVTPRADALDIGAPKPLFRPRFTDTPVANARYSVSRDGKFLVREGAAGRSITVILNFFEQLKRAAAN